MTRNTAYSDAHRYANNDTSQNPAHPAPRPVAVDPNAAEVVAVNTVQAPEPTTGLGAVVELSLEGCWEIRSVEDAVAFSQRLLERLAAGSRAITLSMRCA